MFTKFLRTVTVLSLLCSPTVYADAMLGAYVKNDGWVLDEIDNWNTAATKPMVITNFFTNFDHTWKNLNIQSNNVISRKAIPMITWMPSTSTRPKANILTEITSGMWDSYIDDWILGFKAWRSQVPEHELSRIMLRFGHEFNSNWYSWGNDPQNFVAAWRYVYERFEAAGVNPYIEWVWCANNVDVDDVDDITKYYPGDTYVDWTGLDGYNWGSNFSFTKWKSFDETFSSPYNKLIDNYPTKPIVIAEVGSAEPLDIPNPSAGQDGDDSDNRKSKSVWIKDMFTRIPASYPAIRAVVWFNINKELSWALHYPNNTGLIEYKKITKKPYYAIPFKNITK